MSVTIRRDAWDRHQQHVMESVLETLCEMEQDKIVRRRRTATLIYETPSVAVTTDAFTVQALLDHQDLVFLATLSSTTLLSIRFLRAAMGRRPFVGTARLGLVLLNRGTSLSVSYDTIVSVVRGKLVVHVHGSVEVVRLDLTMLTLETRFLQDMFPDTELVEHALRHVATQRATSAAFSLSVKAVSIFAMA